MAIEIQPYAPGREAAVKAFNQRLRDGGNPVFRLPENCHSTWLPPAAGETLHEEFLLANDGEFVRGGYVLKHQMFWMNGTLTSVGYVYSPISEGTVNPQFGKVGLQLMLHAVKRQPLLYCLGMGGLENPLPKLLKALSWKLCAVPFFFRVVNPSTFLKNIAFLRRRPALRVLLDALAVTGLGHVGIKTLNFARRSRASRTVSLTTESVREFSNWVDDIWQAGHADYQLAAVRDTHCLQRLYPAAKEKYHKLRVTSGGVMLGWAVVLDTAMKNHKQFGNMRVGSIIDGFALPGRELEVTHAAAQFLESRGVDIIVSNQSHTAWRAAYAQSGFLSAPSNYIFAASTKLAQQLAPFETQQHRIHFNRGDGEGPSHL